MYWGGGVHAKLLQHGCTMQVLDKGRQLQE